ncbi:MAG: hemin uptake protein HemP [Rhizobiaceae bacterium]
MTTQNTGFELRTRRLFDSSPVATVDPTRQVRSISTNELFQRGEHEIAIQHGDSVYSLKITKQDRLVLNK